MKTTRIKEIVLLGYGARFSRREQNLNGRRRGEIKGSQGGSISRKEEGSRLLMEPFELPLDEVG